MPLIAVAVVGRFGGALRRRRTGSRGDACGARRASPSISSASSTSRRADPGRAADRPPPHRRDRRGRLSRARPIDEIAERLGARRADGRRASSRSSRASIRPASAPAISPNASPSSSASATAIDPAMAALLARLDLVAKRDLRGAAAALRRRRRGSCRHARRDPPARAEARPRLRRRAGSRCWSRTSSSAPRPDGSWLSRAQSGHPAARPRQPDLLRPGREGARRRGRQGLPRRLPADRQLADPQPRPARQHHPQGRDARSCASRTASSGMASRICARST